MTTTNDDDDDDDTAADGEGKGSVPVRTMRINWTMVEHQSFSDIERHSNYHVLWWELLISDDQWSRPQ